MSTTKQSHSATVAAQRAELEAAVANRLEQRHARRAADKHLETLETRLRAGDAEVSADDLVRARTEVERMATLHDAAERRAELAQRRLGNDDMTVPLILAELVQPVLGGTVNVTGRPGKPEGLASMSVGAVPETWIIQTKPSTFDTLWGRVNADVVFGRLRSEHHRALDAKEVKHGTSDKDYLAELEQALAPHKVLLTTDGHGAPRRVRVTSEALGNGLVWEQTEPVQVHAFTRTPVIADVKPNALNGVVVNDRLPASPERDGYLRDTWVQTELTVTSQTVNGNGVRTVVAEGDVWVQGTQPWGKRFNDPAEAIPHLNRLIDATGGTLADAVGYVTTCEMIGKPEPRNLTFSGGKHWKAQGAAVKVRIVAVSTDPAHVAQEAA